MGKETGISWTTHTFNPWWGCTKVSPGCDHCYAEEVDARFGGTDPHWGKGVPRKTFGEKHWSEPLAWQRAAEKANRVDKVFCASMADVMDDEAPKGERERLWALIDKTPNLIWQLLTKRPRRYDRYLPENGFKHNNVWLGTTCEDQRYYALRWPILSRMRNLTKLTTFISYEPALGPLTLRRNSWVWGTPDWVIFGGETGEGRRPMELAWAESIKRECEEFGVAFFLKQLSAKTPKQAAALIPPELLIRQFPA